MDKFNQRGSGEAGATASPPETIDELTRRALAVLSDAAGMAYRLSIAIAGSGPTNDDSQPKSLLDGLVARQEDAMRQVMDMASQIHNDSSRALARIGA